MKSIRRSLLQWLIPSVLLAIMTSAIAVYFVSVEEASEIFDYHLRQMALSLPERMAPQVLPPTPLGSEEEDDFLVQIWDRQGTLVYASNPGGALPRQGQLGFATILNDHGDWRVFTAASATRIVQVAQSMKVRDELATGIASRTTWPLLFLIPLVSCLVWYFVGRGLEPLHGMARALGERSPDALQPLPESELPAEVRPLVVALNELLVRLGNAIRFQRAFVVDAAHELRTPLTAVKLRVELAKKAVGGQERAFAFEALESGLKRSIHLVEQLLVLARQDPEIVESPPLRVDLAHIARDSVAEYAPIANAKNVDLGAIADQPLFVRGEVDALRAMAGNLIDNAIRYTPGGGRVDVEVRSDGAHVQMIVTDTGPGIPVHDRERVFDRFYRREGTVGAGSGLGLAIVRSVADRFGAAVKLESQEGPGLRATIDFAPEGEAAACRAA